MRLPYYMLVVLLLAGCAAKEINTGLAYRHRAPAGNDPNAPIIVMLHGYGSNEQDLFSLAGAMPGRFHVVSVRAPNTMGNRAYNWFDLDFLEGQKFGYEYAKVVESREKLADFISTVCRKYRADSNRVVLFGFSQGAIMGYDMVLHMPERFIGLAALSGGILPESRESAQPGDALRGVSFFIGHGRADDVVNFSSALEASQYLETRGVQVALSAYPGGHHIPEQELKDIRIWLDSFTR